MSKVMARYIEHLLKTHGQETPEGAAVAVQVQLKNQLNPWQGALRELEDFDGLYEMLCLVENQGGPMQRQALVSVVFEAESVSSVIFTPQAGALLDEAPTPPGVRRSGGLIVGGD